MTGALENSCVSVLVLSCALCAEAGTLKVSPGQLMVRDVEPGKLYDLYKETGTRLTVFNDDALDHTWVLSAHRPSERGRWEAGYGEIPEAAWCWFQEPEITVPANGKAYGHLFFRIPDEERFFNQHWIVTLIVQGKRGQTNLGLAVAIRMQIETKSKSGVSSRPHGLLAMSPSSIRFDNVVPGSKRQESVVLFNNDTKEHTYTIGSLFLAKKHEPKTYLQHTYSLLPERTWLRSPKSISIGPGAQASLDLTLHVPAVDENFAKKWEDIILIQPELGRAEFVRIQVETEPSKPSQAPVVEQP